MSIRTPFALSLLEKVREKSGSAVKEHLKSITVKEFLKCGYGSFPETQMLFSFWKNSKELILPWNLFISKQTLLKTYAGAIPQETGPRNLDAKPGGQSTQQEPEG